MSDFVVNLVRVFVVVVPVLTGVLNGLAWEGVEILTPPDDEAVSAIASGITAVLGLVLGFKKK